MVSPQWSDKLTMLEISGGHHPLGLQGGVGPGAVETGRRWRREDGPWPSATSGERLLTMFGK